MGARLSTDASIMRSLVGDTLAVIFQNLVTVAAGLVISFTANWILALIILATLPLMGFQGYLQSKFLQGFSADAKVLGFHYEMCRRKRYCYRKKKYVYQI